MEWYAPRLKNVSPSRTSLIQMCSSADYCAVFARGAFDELPASLRTFLCNADILKVGNNIQGDFKKLHKDFSDLNGLAGPYAELTSFLPQQPAKKHSLADLVFIFTGMKMDKDLGGGALANWAKSELSAAQLQYAVNDASAGRVVYEALLLKKEGIALPMKET
ncbi:unnamed protein product, partial [Scytosiphon promiscuus]